MLFSIWTLWASCVTSVKWASGPCVLRMEGMRRTRPGRRAGGIPSLRVSWLQPSWSNGYASGSSVSLQNWDPRSLQASPACRLRTASSEGNGVVTVQLLLSGCFSIPACFSGAFSSLTQGPGAPRPCPDPHLHLCH